jgi:hypothetical protein
MKKPFIGFMNKSIKSLFNLKRPALLIITEFYDNEQKKRGGRSPRKSMD